MRAVIVATVLALPVCPAVASDIEAVKQNISIPAQPLGPALEKLAKERDFQILYRSDVVGNLRTEGAEGTLSADEALKALLKGTGLTYRYLGERAVTIVPTTAGVSSGAANDEGRSASATSGAAGLHLARVQSPAASSNASAGQGADEKRESAAGARNANDGKLEEVIVTAQKREERLIDVPIAVSVLSAETLRKSGATQFRDWASSVPGLSFETTGAGRQQVSLRGLAMVVNLSPMVGIYLDEVPYGSTSPTSYGYWLAFDSSLADLDRIEVLKGPQGTLYGASSMGGLIKYVTSKPSMEGFFGKVQTGLSSTRAGSLGYNGALTLNAPLIENKLALRFSAFYTHDGGYVDNVTTGREDVNRANIRGARADLLYTPTENLSIRVNAFAQDIDRDGDGLADFNFNSRPVVDTLSQRRPISELFDQQFRLFSATVNYDLGWATLTSTSGYQTADSAFNLDASSFYVPYLASIGRSVASVGSFATGPTDKFTQEVRIGSDTSRPLEWVFGGFYTYEVTSSDGWLELRDAGGNLLPNDLFNYYSPSRLEEYAAFGTVTWHLSDRIDVAGGLRYAQNRQKFAQFSSGTFIGNVPVHGRSSGDAVTYLANARYHFSDRSTGYLRYATGYRPGGPNFVTSDANGNPLNPASFDADTLKSYEIGFKSESADRRFGIDAAAFYEDWSNMIIINVSNPIVAYRDNAVSGATVAGAELALTVRPVSALELKGSFAYMDAKMSAADRNLQAAKGERLPTVPRFTANFDADYEFVGARWQPTVGMALRYVSDRTTGFGSSATFVNYNLPEYTAVDLRAGLTLGPVDTQLYVRNLFDEAGQMSARIVFAEPHVAIIQPRTIGVLATINF